MDKYLLVILCIEDSIDPESRVPNSICGNAATNMQGTAIMLHCCLQTRLLYHSPAKYLWQQLNISHSDSSIQSPTWYFSASMILYLSWQNVLLKLYQRSINSTSWHPALGLKLCLGEALVIQNSYLAILCLVAVLSPWCMTCDMKLSPTTYFWFSQWQWFHLQIDSH